MIAELLVVRTDPVGLIASVLQKLRGRWLVSGSFEGAVRLWDTASGHLLKTFVGHHGGVQRVALSTTGEVIASGGFDQTVILWETASGP